MQARLDGALTENEALSLCHLTADYVVAPTTTPALVAAVIVHEAMHARLFRWGFDYEEERRMRVEHICMRAEIAFACRLPLSEKTDRKNIIGAARRKIERRPEEWTDRRRLERTLQECEKSEWPRWIVALICWRGRKQLARMDAASAQQPETSAVCQAEKAGRNVH